MERKEIKRGISFASKTLPIKIHSVENTPTPIFWPKQGPTRPMLCFGYRISKAETAMLISFHLTF